MLEWQVRVIELKKKRGRGRPNLPLAPVGKGGVWGGCAPSEVEKKHFQSQFARFWCILFVWDVHTKRGALSLQKYGAPPAPTLNPPLNGAPLVILITFLSFSLLCPPFFFSFFSSFFSFLSLFFLISAMSMYSWSPYLSQISFKKLRLKVIFQFLVTWLFFDYHLKGHKNYSILWKVFLSYPGKLIIM